MELVISKELLVSLQHASCDTFQTVDNNNRAPSLPRPVLSGLVWHQTSGLFSRWKEVFVILTRDCIRCHKISGSAKNAQFGGLLFSVDLVLVTDVRYVERRGYLTLCLEGQGLTRTYLRRTDGIRLVVRQLFSYY